MRAKSPSPSKSHNELFRRLGYAFADPALLERALTHRSYGGNHYERLEFLGDSVLSFAISAELYDRFPELTEGELTRLRASLVKQDTLAQVARRVEIGEALLLGGGELKSGGFERDSILADALEAVLGAVFLDGGIAAARATIARLFHALLAELDPRTISKDPKTSLQELLQKQALATPSYQLLETSGDAHNQTFVVECRVPELSLCTRGEGSTRRAAEQQAAQQALVQLAAK
jgi:ribonuclease-3